jgi:nitrogen fixation protein FixH
MNRKTLLSTLGLVFAVAALGAPIAAGAAAQPLAVAAAFTPNPPKTGSTTIVVTVSDRGKPVSGAKVSIKTDMPAMSMSGPTLTATDNGDGTYSALTNLTDATTWRFRISAKAGANAGTAVVTVDVK